MQRVDANTYLSVYVNAVCVASSYGDNVFAACARVDVFETIDTTRSDLAVNGVFSAGMGIHAEESNLRTHELRLKTCVAPRYMCVFTRDFPDRTCTCLCFL